MLLLIKFSGFSQQLKANFIELQTDNDAYLLIGQDRYYTNGLILTYGKPLRQNAFHTDLLTFQVGHQLFNGKRLYDNLALDWDRPSTGRLFFNGRFQRAYIGEWLWSVKTEVGVVGSAAKGKQVQRFIHRVFNMYEVEGWDSQLRSEIGVDLEATFLKSLWRNNSNSFEVSTGGSGRAGMSFSNLSGQITFRAGKLATYKNSNFVGNGGFYSKEAEYYFYLTPGYTYQFYNTSIQGKLFEPKINEHYSVSPHVFTQQLGFDYSKANFAVGINIFFNTKEGRNMVKNHQYASIKAGVRF